MSSFVIHVKNISKSYYQDRSGSTAEQILDNISFTIPKGKIISIVGPNGCGKTTILNILARILMPDKGKIELDPSAKETMSSSYPITSYESLRISYIPQNSSESLFPWKRAWDNIAFSLELKSNKSAENRIAYSSNNEVIAKVKGKRHRQARAEQLVSELGLKDILTDMNQYPYQLSGGQKQACSIARAVMHEPELLLMDEPFASLDYETKLTLEDKLLEILNKMELTCVMVSHDIDEAAYVSDIVIVLTRKPTRVIGIVPVNFDSRRKRTLITTSEFFYTRNRILELLKAGSFAI